MDITEFLRLGGTDQAGVLSRVEEIAGLKPDDLLLAAGSLVEGLGSRKSDLDLFLIADQPPAAFRNRDEIIFSAGTCVIDVRVLARRRISDLLQRLAGWDAQPWDSSDLAPFSHDDRVLLHRLSCGPVWRHGATPAGERAIRPPAAALARLKLHVARHAAKTIQVDMAGYQENQDYRTLALAAQKLLGHAVDALAGGHGLTNPISKWRSRLLDRLPADWEAALLCRPSGLQAAELHWRLQRTPEHADSGVLAYAQRISAFSRAAFLWAEQTLLWPPAAGRQDRRPGTRAAVPVILPALRFDVDFCLAVSGGRIARLNEFGAPLDLSEDEFRLVPQFDGITTIGEAAVTGGGDGVEAAKRVSALAGKLVRAGFCEVQEAAAWERASFA